MVFKRGLKNKRGQVKMSFGMIFSIFLIVVFIGFAFYIISTILSLQDSASSGRFANEIQNDVDKIWRSSESRDEIEYLLPSEVDYACFVDFKSEATGDYEDLYDELRFIAFNEDENLVLYPSESGQGSFTIEHLDLSNVKNSQNPFCFKESSGKIKVTFVKNFDDPLVGISG